MSAEQKRTVRFRAWDWPSDIVIPEQVLSVGGSSSERAIALAIVEANGGPEVLTIKGMNQTADGTRTFRISIGFQMSDVPMRTHVGYIAID